MTNINQKKGESDVDEKVDSRYTMPCPVCGAPNQIDKVGTYDICVVCGWEDDNYSTGKSAYEVGMNICSSNEAKRLLQEGKKMYEEYPWDSGLKVVEEAVASGDEKWMTFLDSCYEGIRRDLYPAILEGAIQSKNPNAITLCEKVCEEMGIDVDVRIYE